MRWRCQALIAAAALSVSTRLLAAPLSDSSERFLRAREVYKPSVSADVPTLRRDPGKLEHKYIEFSGLVFGRGGADGSTFALVRCDPGGRPINVLLPENTTFRNWPEVVEGANVRFICRVERDPVWRDGTFILQSVIPEADAPAVGLTVESLKPLRVPPKSPRIEGLPLVERYAQAIHGFRDSVDLVTARKYAGWILEFSGKSDMDARLIMALIATESNFQPSAVSRTGALGLAQIMPRTAEDLHVDPRDPKQCTQGAVEYLSRMIGTHRRAGRPLHETYRLALACYNAGPGAVKNAGGIPPYGETQNYVRRVMGYYYSMLTDRERANWSP